MADNLTLNPGSGGATIAADDVSSVHYPVGKVDLGGDGATVPWVAGQTTMSGSAPVVIASNQTAIAVTASAGTNLNTSALALEAGGNLAAAAASLAALDNAVSGSELQVDVVAALPAGTNAIGKLAANSGVDIGDVDVTSIAAGDNNIGNVDIVTVPADPFGVNADAASATGSISAKLRFIAATGIPITGTVTVGSHAVTNAGTFAVQPGPTTAGGCTPYSFLSTAAVIAAELKGSAGQIYGLQLFNTSTAPVFVRLYNQTGAPGTGDAANIVWRGVVPANADSDGAGFVVTFGDGPIACGTGIGIRVTAAVADNDNTALTANVILGNVQYK